MKKKASQPPGTLISATAIARRIKRSPQGVIDAISRLKIAPALTLPSGNYYPPDAVDAIAAGMRRKNGVKTQG